MATDTPLVLHRGIITEQGPVVTNNGTFNDDPGTGNHTFQYRGDPPPTFNNIGTYTKVGSGTTTFGVAFNNSGMVHATAGILSFAGDYTQTAGATVLNGGSVSSSTSLNIQGGTLNGSGTITGGVNNTGGQVSPGLSPGILNITSNYTQGASGAYNVEVGGLTPGTDFDQLNIGGGATLDGTLNVSLINSFTPNLGDTFTILTHASGSGTFSSTSFPAAGQWPHLED